MNNEHILKLVEDGKVVEYNIILAFLWLKTKKNYIVYTDNTLDEDDNLNVYAAIYYPDDPTKLDPIENDFEWDEIDKRLKLIKWENNNG